MKVRSHRIACDFVLLGTTFAMKMNYDSLESKQLVIGIIYGIVRVIQSINKKNVNLN